MDTNENENQNSSEEQKLAQKLDIIIPYLFLAVLIIFFVKIFFALKIPTIMKNIVNTKTYSIKPPKTYIKPAVKDGYTLIEGKVLAQAIRVSKTLKENYFKFEKFGVSGGFRVMILSVPYATIYLYDKNKNLIASSTSFAEGKYGIIVPIDFKGYINASWQGYNSPMTKIENPTHHKNFDLNIGKIEL